MDEEKQKRVRELIRTTSDAFETGFISDKLRKGDKDYYDIVTVAYPFGARSSFKKKQQDAYEKLQSSRCGMCELPGPSTYENIDTVEMDYLLKAPREHIEKLTPSDLVQSRELEEISESDDVMKFRLEDINSFCELGFRVPRLLRYYEETYKMGVSGYDVLELNIIMSKHMGYEVQRYDFDDCAENLKIDAGLVVSYHMLEHVTDPLLAIIKIYNAMNHGAFLHVEVPIEGPGRPNIRYCHMYAFEPHDLGKMLELAGFKIYTLSNKTHEGGPYVERYLAQKTKDKKCIAQQVPATDVYRRWKIVT